MALRKARACIAASHEVEAAGEEVLAKGNAVDAVVASVFAAAALAPGVLFGPVQLLVGGGGAGHLALDGRVRQPGIGAPRPRGFVSAEEIPDAARIGVPWLPATLSAAIAALGGATFAQVLAPAIALAKGTPRAELLARIASRGPGALDERPVSVELLAAAGRPNGGLLTPDDLTSARPQLQKATRTEIDPARVAITLPWGRFEDGEPRPPAAPVDVARARSALAVDRNGMFAIACWDEATEGLMIDELGLRAPFFAEPVRRGQSRVKPGDPRPAAAPIVLLGSPAAPEIALAAFGAGDAYAVLGGAIAGLARDARIEAHGEARLVALSHARGEASAFRS